jgi:hypothetical protein
VFGRSGEEGCEWEEASVLSSLLRMKGANSREGFSEEASIGDGMVTFGEGFVEEEHGGGEEG